MKAPPANKNDSVVLQPFRPPPAAGPKRYVGPALLLALSALCVPYGFFYALTTPYLIVPMAVPLGVLAALSIWALPDSRAKPIPGLETLLFSFLCAIIVWPNYIAISLPGLPWITVIRLFGFPLAIIFLVSLSITPSFRQKNAEIHDTSIPIWKFILVLFALQILTIPLSKEIFLSFQKVMIWQINFTCIFFVSAYVFTKAGKPSQWLLMLLGTGVVTSVIGLAEGIEKKVLWAGHIPGFLKVDTESVAGILAGAARSATGLYRVKGTASTPLGLSELIALSMPFIIHMVAGRFGWRTKLIAGVTMVMLIFVMLSTDSRLGVLGTILAFLLYFSFWSIRRWRSRPRDLFAPALLFLSPFVFALGLASTFFVRRIQLRVWGGGAQQASDQARADQIEKGVPMILKNPIGHGAGQAAETLGYHGGGGKLTIDNYFLSIALDYGVVGFLAFYGMIAFAAWHAGKLALQLDVDTDPEFDFFAPLSVALIVFIVIKSVFSQLDNHGLVFAMLGMVVALTYRYRQLIRATTDTVPSISRSKLPS